MGLLARAQTLIAGHPGAALLVIAALGAALLAGAVHYRGVAGYGPYAAAPAPAPAPQPQPAPAPAPAGDTDALIRSIQQA